jgi:hypothetical protein
MRTSLTRLSSIEEFLAGNISQENRIVFDANLLLDNQLAIDISSQAEAYKIIKLCSRQILKSELETLHGKLLANPENKSFWSSIRKIFQKN